MTIPSSETLAAARLPRAFYDRDTATVARELLGCLLVHRVDGEERIGRIVETEAYVGAHDLASHSSKGITKRTRVMFGPPGHAYVYLIYGMHHCLNVVTEGEGQGAAVLLRALEPVRNLPGKTSGPGLLCRAMGIDLRYNGCDLQSDELHICAGSEQEVPSVVERARIGVDYAGAWALQPLRFYIAGNAHVSRK
ncbi:DNA-3-methyladenine glycosylase [Noviherbaspirillum pedocola]|uniref:Putative 3-methyladenine DNA glycosylase n=1 Tax=Noviherbaspirillum pedocola TaxID=2801341 RepID=A0A934T1N2_9BURK|nr:DNA-3-methyladenine glycosylase [Noviherbaspirillum pedocola]MBK4737129.1 DNA-3-methyladenine glycosylase [Noviherbaspirillum pedocola]